MAKRTENKKENGCYAIGKWFAWVVALLVTGCSPKVATEIYHSYPATQADDVQVFKTGTNRPYSAELLGKVAVKGNGYTAHFSYDQVVALAKAETAKVGGNALAITEHKEPTILVSCHQIKGEMLRMKTQQREQIRKADSLELAGRKSIKPRKLPPPLPIHIYGNGGFGHVFSKAYHDIPGGLSGTFKNGVDFQGGIDWVGKKFMGVGILYSGYRSGAYHTNFVRNPDYPKEQTANPKSRMHLDYIGPEFVMRAANKHWSLRYGIGVGAFILNVEEEMDFSMGKTVKGMGLHYQLCADYLLSKHVGTGVNAGVIYGNVYDKNGVIPGSMDQSVEFYRIFINGGLHFYF